ncbi:MAG TPA: response regulator, partial [Segetibacter sp.]|nr:response regulator [Segetibacter sp.]
MVTILCVDDEVDMEEMVKQMFRRQIRNNEYQFVFAHNGREALIQLNQHPETKLILSDINMPEMDGLTLLGHIKEEYKNNYIKTIMVSAYGDMQNIRTAMNKGAFDFVTKPIMFDDFDTTIKKTINEIEIYSELLSEHDKLVSIQADLSTAHEIQQAMLPKDPDPYPNRKEFSLHGLVEPAKSVGGDLFEYVLIDENRLFFMIGDVSDKGVQASLIMAITKILFKTRFTDNPGADLVAEVCKINNLLSTDNPQMMFVTTFASILDLTTGEVEYVDGGHERPLIIRAA